MTSRVMARRVVFTILERNQSHCITSLYFWSRTTFHTGALKSFCDWLALSDSIFDWSGAPPSWHQFENPHQAL